MTDNPMSRSNFDDVGFFHQRFELPSVTHQGAHPRRPDNELINFRIKFLCEELQEILEGLGVNFMGVDLYHRVPMRSNDAPVDHAAVFDGHLDLVYVALGNAHLFGYPWQEGWDRVQEANMSKLRAKKDGSDSTRGSSYDIVKPAGFRPPDIQGLLSQFGWNFIPPHAFEAFEGSSGMACTAMVLRDGHGDSCGLKATDSVHFADPVDQAQCPARHPATGNLCVEDGPHTMHKAMGVMRMQIFGDNLQDNSEDPK